MPAIFSVVGIAALAAGVVGRIVWLGVVGVFFLVQTAVFLHTTLRGKHVVWRGLLDDLDLEGTERILDVGCGRGAVLIAAAQRVPSGRVDGVDLWKSADQSGNGEATTRSNAQAMGVAALVHLHTADMVALPFDDASFDDVVSSLAVHNIEVPTSRAVALDEMVRVLRPAGRLVIVDLRHATSYAAQLEQRGLQSIVLRKLGPQFWFGGPWQSASAVTAESPLRQARATRR